MSQLRIQDARAVAYRALCLGALVKRGEIEVAVQDVDEWSVFDGVREHFLSKHQNFVVTSFPTGTQKSFELILIFILILWRYQPPCSRLFIYEIHLPEFLVQPDPSPDQRGLRCGLAAHIIHKHV